MAEPLPLKQAEAPPLPRALQHAFNWFPIILFVPDMIFNYMVYSDGVSQPFDINNPSTWFSNALWSFLATGIVGMAWLCSVLAPWHWIRGNRFQSVMCWLGVFIATGITTWNSLAFRSQAYKSWATDQWFEQTFHIAGSPTMLLVAVAPPFWGLFWAIVQPTMQKRSLAEEELNHQQKLERLKQEAEYKRFKAEANAGVRQAQLTGLVNTAKAARRQMGGRDEAELLAAPAPAPDLPADRLAAPAIADRSGITLNLGASPDASRVSPNSTLAQLISKQKPPKGARTPQEV